MDMPVIERRTQAVAILDDFATRTGVSATVKPCRYLWTDAFAVMTWIGLHEETGEARYLDLASRLVAQVHDVLGVSRDPQHPTSHGLRIGKPLPERAPDEPYDPELEWERDGQYFHYLTKWMHALERMAHATSDDRYRRWAADLAKTAHRAFAYPAGAPTRMYWKMSIDLSRPLVASMGAHDPLDGLIEAASLGLEREKRDFARMCEDADWAGTDPLGAGGLLLAALRLARLVADGRDDLQPLLGQVLADAARSAEASATSISGPASRRLAFRELGFALGLHAVEPLAQHCDVARLRRFLPFASKLEEYWLDPHNQAAATWTAHSDINAVTLAACLAPKGMLA